MKNVAIVGASGSRRPGSDISRGVSRGERLSQPTCTRARSALVNSLAYRRNCGIRVSLSENSGNAVEC